MASEGLTIADIPPDVLKGILSLLLDAEKIQCVSGLGAGEALLCLTLVSGSPFAISNIIR